MKKIYGIAITLLVIFQSIAQKQETGEVACDFASGATVTAKDKKFLTFIGENCNCTTLLVIHENGIDKIEVESDCKVDVSKWLRGVKSMKLVVEKKGGDSQPRTLSVVASDAVSTGNSSSAINQNQRGSDNPDTPSGGNPNPPIDFNANVLPDNFLKLSSETCINTDYAGAQSKVIEYNICCNQFYYNYYPGKHWFPLKGRAHKTKSGQNKWGISKLDLFQKGTRVFVNDPLVFKTSNINYRNYLTTVTRNYTSENEEVPELFEKAFSLDPSGLESYGGCENDIKLWLYNKNSQLTSYFQGLPHCMSVDQFNRWNKEIKENLNSTFATVCDECDVKKIDIVACLKVTFFEELNGTGEKDKGEENERNDDASLITDFLNLYYALDKKFHDFQYNVPQVKNYDEIEFTLNVLPKDSTAGIYLTDEKVSIPIFGGFKIDGSTGLFYSSLTDHEFSTIKDSVRLIAQNGTISYRSGHSIIRQKTATGDPGLAGMVHFYSRWGKSLNLAFSLGTGFTFVDNPQPRYLIGGSALIGRKERLALSYGVSFGQVTRLKREFEDPDLYPDVTNITTKKFDTGYFLSLTYNIPFRKKKQQVAPSSGSTPPPIIPTTAQDNSGGKESEDDQGSQEEGNEEEGENTDNEEQEGDDNGNEDQGDEGNEEGEEAGEG